MANSNIKYFKTTFTGIFYSREKTHLPYYKFNNIEWEQIKFPLIENIQELEFYEALEEQTSNSWYQKVLKPYKNFFFSKQWLWLWPKIISTNYFPWIRGVKWNGLTIKRRPHIILPLSDKFQLQENLHEVILKQIEFIDDNGKEWDGGLRRVKGVALFQIHLNPPNKKESAVVEPGKAVDPIPNQAGNIGLENNEVGVTNIWEINKQLQDKAIVSSPDQVPFQMSKKQNRLWLWIILLWLIFCLWKLPVLFFPSLILLGAITFYRFFRRACLSIFISIIIFGILGYFLLNLLPGKGKKQEAVKTEDGSIKISPPKRTDNKDLLSEKEISWWDFIKNKYKLSYATSATSFFESETANAENYKQIQAKNSLEFYYKLYSFMEKNDSPKLYSIIQKFRIKAKEKNLNALKTAEMVCAFVQEIPYYLVHDFDCQKAIEQSGSDFLTQYHRENKPCLQDIPGGVQSPYEFMHNLKGDCDTRSLLAFSILKKLGISSSVWVSETYGHSVLGVGLPAGNGFYIKVKGDKHYAIELTAKGFRLGMISPEQQIGNNWDIALFYKR